MGNDCKNCIECGQCTKSCVFLDKYHINLREYASTPDLAYNCFLCGKCKLVCPVNMDGREISLRLRENKINTGHQLEKGGYRFLLAEKRNYLFKNHRHGRSSTVLFPGCNFTAYYPKTTRLLSQMLMDKAGISTIYDCCGKPVGELGLTDDEVCIVNRLNESFSKNGITEIIILCPNCYYYLKDRLEIKISNIYDKLLALNIVYATTLEDGLLYMPCPDRDTQRLLCSIKAMLTGPVNFLENIQCCGAGGCAGIVEPELASGLRQCFTTGNVEKVYTYCATCSGMIAKSGMDTEHILIKLLNTGEKPAQGIHSLLNRAMFKII